MDQNLIDSARKLLDNCIKKGASAAEILAMESKELRLTVENTALDMIKDSEERVIAARILIDHSPGFGFCTDFSASSLSNLADQIINAAKNTDEDIHNLFPKPNMSDIKIKKDERITLVGIKEKFKCCQEMEKAAYSVDKRIKVAREISYAETITDVFLINSNGLDVGFDKAMCSIFTMVVAQNGAEAQMSWEMDIQTQYDRLKWKEVPIEAAKKALALLGAKGISTRKSSIILSPTAAISLLGSFAPAFYADSVQKGRSLMAGKLGHAIGAMEVNLIDNGMLPDGLATAPYDDEGVPMQQTNIIEKGILKSYLYDTYTAHKAKVKSTGNGIRLGARSQPQVGSTNMYIGAGEITEAEIISKTKNGLYVNEIMGAHTINPISGDFSVGATGHWIEDGEKVFPVRGVILSGNMLELFKNIACCANNTRFYGHFGSPSILVSEMIISGE